MRWNNEYSKEWHRKFALFPKNMDGQTIWLEFYEMRYIEQDKSKCGAPCRVAGWIQYRTISKNRIDTKV